MRGSYLWISSSRWRSLKTHLGGNLSTCCVASTPRREAVCVCVCDRHRPPPPLIAAACLLTSHSFLLSFYCLALGQALCVCVCVCVCVCEISKPMTLQLVCKGVCGNSRALMIRLKWKHPKCRPSPCSPNRSMETSWHGCAVKRKWGPEREQRVQLPAWWCYVMLCYFLLCSDWT